MSRGAVLAALGVASMGVASSAAAAEPAAADPTAISLASIEWNSISSVEWNSIPLRHAQDTEDDGQAPTTGLEEKSVEWN
ncbi:hypothetical protein [Catellatospora methionotrophica]|uniref:hypothetical protein n=1 Tax=Catellatospora methionotrophica TaxID=121620 RepID=UPI0033F38917